jgi:hypothetical protein
MSRRLGDVFGELIADEPPIGLVVDDLVIRGRRRGIRRRRIIAAVTVAVVLPLLGLAAVVVAHRPFTPGPPSIVAIPSTDRVGGASENRLADPGFEASPLTWNKFGASTVVTATTATVRSGKQAAQVVTTSATPVTAGVISRPVLVVTTAGARYTASCWVRATRAVLVYVQVQEYTPAWARVTDPAKSPRLTLDDPQQWYRASVTYTATTTGNQLPLSVFGNAMTADGTTLFVDDCELRSA